MTERSVDVWPFHEMIVHAIRNEDLDPGCWLWILCHTLIPTGHDAILSALEEVHGEINSYWDEEVASAKKHVLEQKRLAEEKAMKKVAEAAEKLRRLDDALAVAGVVDDDDSATPPDSVAEATLVFEELIR